ncbi:phospholipase D-like domain-containing protein [Fibrobacter sp. UWH1]|uniref:phospholipase D-like domain-containing protein n=1 Tax=Fibrobacter sp. UWH1 TaxID=1964354 RepID=UPI000B524F4E|nr:phospholipase D-like domain-containing protein [Fibrobacter sp. UWH1]OWV03388.1 phospholipase [Fibrobacter sp. UWH1]
MAEIFTKYIANEEHYSEVIERIAKVRDTLWIGTADIKDLYVKQNGEAIPLLGQIGGLLKRGVGVRLVHAKEPGPNFREDFDRFPILATDLERVLCPRVHFKMVIFDLEVAYIGSANLTGAGIGMKSALKRNFEAGILTNDPQIVEAAINQFDTLWMGAHCKNCGRLEYCGDRIK